MPVPLIEFKNVTKGFENRKILEQVNFKIYEGEVTTLIGKSGAGKSVLLKHIIGLLKPDQGSVVFRGKPLEEMGSREWKAYLGQISYMFQNNALFDSLTVYDNIALPLRENSGLSKQKINQKVMAQIEQAELADVAYKYPSEISGGMQKRTALARALVTDPKIVLFDELTTGQDPVRRNAILGMILEYKKKFGFTAILISHDIPDIFFVSNRVLVLYDKMIVFQGTPDDLVNFDHPFNDEIINSIEYLRDELTGLHSKRQFKVRYQTDLSRKIAHGSYAVILFTLKDLNEIMQKLGHAAAQESIRTMGAFISKHFGVVGGISARRSIDQFSTVLPFSDLKEAKRLLEKFVRDLNQHGLVNIETAARQENKEIDCVEFSILAGLARGTPDVELESIMEFAGYEQKPIAEFSCALRAKPA